MNKKLKVLIRTIYLTIICCFIVVTIWKSVDGFQNMESSLLSKVEQQWRAQSRETLNYLRADLEHEMRNSKLTSDNKEDLQYWAFEHMSGIRNGGPKSDGSIILFSNDLKDKLAYYVYDASPNITEPTIFKDGRFLIDELFIQSTGRELLQKIASESKLEDLFQITKKPTITYSDLKYIQEVYPTIYKDLNKNDIMVHSDLDHTRSIIDSMCSLHDTVYGDNKFWMSEGSKEYLEWVVVPSSSLGLNNKYPTKDGITNPEFSKILILMSTRENEVLAPYQEILYQIKIIKMLVLTSLVGMLTLFMYFVFAMTYWEICHKKGMSEV